VGVFWYLAFIPIVYIAAITTISRGEVHGGDKKILIGAVGLYLLVIGGILTLMRLQQFSILHAIPFLVLFALMIFPPLLRSIRSLAALDIRLAVKAGVMAVILMDATLAAGFADWRYGLLVLALLPVSRFLAKQFAVT
jgi:4-hydroxybenzoate polyprenyltransferase